MQQTFTHSSSHTNIRNSPSDAVLIKGNFSALALQESTSSLKSKNDIFCFTKKSEKILEKIQNLEIKFAQGYYFSKPIKEPK